MRRSALCLAALGVLAAADARAASLPFLDGFEPPQTGFSGWSATRLDGSNALAQSTAQAWDGTAALRFTYAGSGAAAEAAAAVDFAAATDLWVRAFLRVPPGTAAAMSASSSVRLVRLGDGPTSGGTGGAAKVNLVLSKSSGGVLFLSLEYVNASAGTSAYGQPLQTPITEGTWHYVEFGWEPTATPARVRVFVDDPLQPKLAANPSDTVAHALATCWVGLAGAASGTAAVSLDLDDVAVAATQTGTAQAVALHANELESGTLTVADTPPGKAASPTFSSAGVSVAPSAAAAHRGAWGLQVVDTQASAGAGAGERVHLTPIGSGTLYRRFWWRAVPTSGAGQRGLASLHSTALGGAGGTSVAEVVAAWDGALAVAGHDASATYASASGTAKAASGAWHLVELVASGLGTASGARAVYLDGTLAASQSGIDWTGVAVDAAAEGQTSSADPAFQGTDDLDDLRTARARQPSTLALGIPDLTDGACSAAIAVSARDSEGNPAAVPEPIAVQLVATGVAGTFYSDAGCTSEASSIALGVGTSAATAYFKPAGAGAASLKATNLDYLSAPSAKVVASVASQLAFTSTSQPLVAGLCSGLTTVQSQGPGGAPAAPATDLTVELGSPSTSLVFFSDPICSTPISSVTIRAGQTSAGFYFSDTFAGATSLSATAAPLTAAVQAQTIVAGPPSVLAFATPPRAAVAGSCSAVVTLETRDSLGNPSDVSEPTTLDLLSSSPMTTLFADAACANAASATSIPAGTHALDLYFKDTFAGTTRLTATASGFANAVQDETIAPAPAAKLVFTTAPVTAVAGVCSTGLQLELRDPYGNPAPTAAATAVDLAATPASGRFYTEGGCGGDPVAAATIPAGSATASFSFIATTAGLLAIAATSSGVTGARQTETITAAAASRIAFSTPAQTVFAGVCSAATTVQLRDEFGNPTPSVGPTAVALAGSGASVVIFSAAGCAAAAATTSITVANGADRANLWFKDTTAGTLTLTATSALGTATQNETIKPQAPSRLALASTPFTVAAGDCSPALVVASRDGFGNPSNAVTAITVRLTTTSARGTFFTTPSCTGGAVTQVSIPAGTSSTTFYYRDTLAGTPTVTAANVALSTVTQAETVSPNLPAKLAFTTAAQALTAGTCSAPVTVQVRDAHDNVRAVDAATTLTLSSTAPSTLFHPATGCTAALTTLALLPGEHSASFTFVDDVAGAPTLAAAATDLAPATQVATLVAGPLARIGFGGPPRTSTAGVCSPAVIVQSQDAVGNAVPVAMDVAVTVTVDPPRVGLYAEDTCGAVTPGVTLAAGTSDAAIHFQDTLAGPATIHLSTATLGSASQTQTVAGAAPVALRFQTAPLRLTAGACTPAIVVEAFDALGNPATAPGLAVALSSTSTSAVFHGSQTCSDPTTSVAVGATSTASFSVRDPKAGAATMTATATGLPPVSQEIRFDPGAPAKIAFTSPAQTLSAGTCSTAMAVVESQDALGNASAVAADTSVLLSSSSGAASFFSDLACGAPTLSVTIPSGGTTARFAFQEAGAGAPTLTAQAAGLAAGTQEERIVDPGTPSRLVFTSEAQTLEAGQCSEPATVQIRDATGRCAPLLQAAPLNLSSRKSVTFHDPSDSACATPVSVLYLATGEYRASFRFKDAAAGAPSLKASITGLASAEQAQTIDCPAHADGAYCDDSDLCNGRETCGGGACTPGTAPDCNDDDPCTIDTCAAATGCVHDIDPACCRSPKVAVSSAAAAVGVPYRISPTGQAQLEKGTGPIHWSACTPSPASLRIDPVSAVVTWTPTAAGTQTLCLKAVGVCGSDAAQFDVQVQATPPARPTAVASLAPERLAAGQTLTADGSKSKGTGPLTLQWSWGDSSEDSFGASATHVYPLAGIWPVRLQVWDAVGQVAETTVPAEVSDGACAKPPSIWISADALSGQDALTSTFTAQGAAGDSAPLHLWDFADGGSARGRSVTHTFAPGSWLVRLTVVSSDGCRAEDTAWVTVGASGRTPPLCEISVSPKAGPAPLTAAFQATYSDPAGVVAAAEWTFSDGVTGDATRYQGRIERTLDAPGTLVGWLRATNDGGLACHASATVSAWLGKGVLPPRIVTAPTTTAQCGVPYVYGDDGRARASGSAPIAWSLGRSEEVGRPAGMSIEAAGGQITWTPEQKAGPVRVTLVASNEAGIAEQDFTVQVDCPNASSCGCAQGAGAPALLGLVALASGLLRRRRSPG